MKLTAAVLFTLISFASWSQHNSAADRTTGVAMGLSGGYSSKQSVIASYSIGAMLPTSTHLSVSMIVLSELKKSDMPSIGEVRAGQVLNTWEVYGGFGYHIAGSDNKISTNPNTGLRPALGIIKYFKSSPWTLSATMSGNIFSLQLGLFGIR
ncbi:MAG: hypothetical protein ACR2KZ_13980 [Segetibacter sp.]